MDARALPNAGAANSFAINLLRHPTDWKSKVPDIDPEGWCGIGWIARAGPPSPTFLAPSGGAPTSLSPRRTAPPRPDPHTLRSTAPRSREGGLRRGDERRPPVPALPLRQDHQYDIPVCNTARFNKNVTTRIRPRQGAGTPNARRWNGLAAACGGMPSRHEPCSFPCGSTLTQGPARGTVERPGTGAPGVAGALSRICLKEAE